MRPRLPTIANATSESASRDELALAGARAVALGGQQSAVAASPPMVASHAGSTEFSGSARLRGPVAHGKPVAGLTV